MTACGISTILLLLGLVMTGCGRREKVETFSSPTNGIFFTVETYDGGPGPLGSDTTKVYAHFERHGKSTTVPVLVGDNLTISKIIWNTSYDDTICLNSGFTDTFHNEVTLILGNAPGDSQTIHNYLEEHCP